MGDLINVEIFAENDYTASLNVTEDPLSLGGGWSEKMSSPIIAGGGHGHALAWGNINTGIKGTVNFRYLDAAGPFVLKFSFGGSSAPSATVSPTDIEIPGDIVHYVHAHCSSNEAGNTFNINLVFNDPTPTPK